MIRTMIDTDTPFSLTQRADILATYADLVDPATFARLAAAWPRVILVDRGMGDPLGRATVLDVETGARKPSDVPAWYDHQDRAGLLFLTVYCNRSTLPDVDRAAAGRGIYRWIATLDGTAYLPGRPAGFSPAAIQCLGANATGFHADLSLVFEDEWNPTSQLSTTDQANLRAARGSLNTALTRIGSVLA